MRYLAHAAANEEEGFEMTSRKRARLVLVGLLALLVGGAIYSGLAGAETEAPFWKVAGKRLEAEEKKPAAVKQIKEIGIEEIVVSATLKAGERLVPVEFRCKAAVSKNAELKGSKPHSDAFFDVGLTLSGCKLWANDGKEVVEEHECSVEAIAGEELLGRFWLEGSTAENKNVPVILLKATKIAIFKVTGAGCRFAGEYTLGGSVAVRVSPENTEAAALRFVFPSPPITVVHQAQPEKEEAKVGLTLGGAQASLTGAFETILAGEGKFGAFAPEGEAPFWAINEKRLEAEEKAPAKTTGLLIKKEGKETIVKGELQIVKTEKKGEVEIRCATLTPKIGSFIGSKPGSDASFNVGFALSSCKLWAKNGKTLAEEKECVVEALAGEEQQGRFWLEGTEAENRTELALLFKAAKLATFQISGASCRFAGEFTLGGSVAAKVLPENVEVKSVRMVFPTPTITQLHQAQSAPEKAEPELTLDGGRATIATELGTGMESGQMFGAF